MLIHTLIIAHLWYNEVMHTVIRHTDDTQPPDYLYRLSLKALVRNARGEVLVVKEAGRTYWDLPGGGMNHGDDFHAALARELAEEIDYTGDFTERIVAVEDPIKIERADILQVRMIFAVELATDNWGIGVDGDGARYIDPTLLADSDIRAEQLIYKYSQLHLSR